jgi:hypothetical protein
MLVGQMLFYRTTFNRLFPIAVSDCSLRIVDTPSGLVRKLRQQPDRPGADAQKLLNFVADKKAK